MTICFQVIRSFIRKHRYLSLTIIGFIWWIGWYQLHGPNLELDSMDYAQMARQVYDGKGMTTLQVFPSHLPFFEENNIEGRPFPNLYRFPFPILSMSFFFLLFGVNNFAVAFFSGIFFIMGIPLTYFAGCRFFSSRVALIGVICYAVCLPLLLTSTTGMTESCAATLFTAIISMVVIGCTENRRKLYFLTIGCLMGVGILNRTNFVVFFPILLIFIFIVSGRNRQTYVKLLCVLLGTLSILSPWMVRNIIVIGSPSFSLTVERNLLHRLEGDKYNSFLHIQNRSFKDILMSEPWRVIRKYFRNLTRSFLNYYVHIELFIPFFIIGFIAGSNSITRKLSILLVALGIIQYGVLCIGMPIFRFFWPFIPIFLLYTAKGIEWFFIEASWTRWFKDARKFQRIAKAGIVVFCLLYIALYLKFFIWLPDDYNKRLIRKENIKSQIYKDMVIIDAFVPKGKIIASGSAAFFAWYTQRPSLTLPFEPDDFLVIDKKYLHVDYFHLTFRLMMSENGPSWYDQACGFDDYQPVLKLDSGAVLFRRKEGVIAR